jgi:tetratricopeptide (TPR) repeat protein
MLDCQLFGLRPGWHHLVNALFHTANTLLLFIWLKRSTRQLWPAAFVAALFGWHPLHVESVAWASERKDVLSTFFFLLTLLAYARYVSQSKVQSPKSKVSESEPEAGSRDQEGVPSQPATATLDSTQHAARSTQHVPFWYSLTLLLFVLGLMSKPMLVTVPFVLLLLDYWPLGRFSFFRPPARLLWEKLPFLALSLLSCIVTFLVQKTGGAVSSLDAVPFRLRIATSLEAYAQYLLKTFWPERLAALYPYSAHPNILAVAAAGLLLVALSVAALLMARRFPFVFTGWFWFVGTLVPVIGIIQVGAQAMADRYMYIPSIGLFLAVVWLVVAWSEQSSSEWFLRLRPVLYAASIFILVACLARTSFQLKHWQDGVALFRNSLAAAPENYNGFGKALDDRGRKDEALAAYAEAVRLSPHYEQARYNLATLLAERGQVAEAITNFELALQDNPRYAEAHHNLGNVLINGGKVAEGREHLLQAVTLKPDDPQMHYSLGTVFLMQSDYDRAVAQFSDAVRLAPEHVEAHRNMGFALMRLGKTNEGLAHFSAAAHLEPDNPDARFNLGLALLEQNKLAEAQTQFAAGLRLRPEETRFHYRLAVALARQERTNEAIVQYREALRLTPDFPQARNELAALLAGETDKPR